MLTVSNLHKSYGIETVLSGISFTLNSGERLALIGPNGSGKTTLLRILTGQERADQGSFSLTAPGAQVGYLEQGHTFDPDETLASYLAKASGDLPGLSARLEKLAHELSADPDRPALQAEYDAILTQMESASESEARLPAILGSLGLDELPPDLPCNHLSGGQKTRLSLAGVLIAGPQVLLLDEPTNHLDLDMLVWLEDWLTTPPLRDRSAVLIVSHDRAFIDRTATGILELDAVTHTLKAYPGNYTSYLEAKLAERERQWQAYSDQQDEIARLQGSIAHVRGLAKFRKGGKADTGDKFAKGFFANRGLETMRRAKSLEKRLERLLTDEKVEKPGQTWQMKLDFGDLSESSRDVLVMEDLAVGYNGSPLLEGIHLRLRYGERVALIGPNGSGKTTLLRTITGRLEPLRGRLQLGPSVRPGYMTQEQEDLDPALDAFITIVKQAPFSETEARAFLHRFLFAGDDVFTPVGKLSYGERARLSLACLTAQGCNFLLLDEPINHLDIPSRARFESALQEFEGAILAVVHDRYFIEGFATRIWETRDGEVREKR